MVGAWWRPNARIRDRLSSTELRENNIGASNDQPIPIVKQEATARSVVPISLMAGKGDVATISKGARVKVASDTPRREIL